MKKNTPVLAPLALLLFLFFTVPAIGQDAKPADITNSSTPVTWLGLDFTEARLIGDLGANEFDIKTRIVNDMNQVIVNEAKKYDLQSALRKTDVSVDLSYSAKRNATMDETKLKSSNTADFTRFNKSMVESIVSKYKFDGKKGLAVLFVVEAMNKTRELASIWVTYVDMSNSKVVYTERREGKAGGFGFRNYWLKPTYEILTDLKKGKS